MPVVIDNWGNPVTISEQRLDDFYRTHSLDEYYAELTNRAKAGLIEEFDWRAARAEREAKNAAAAPSAEIKQPARKSRPVTTGKWTRWP
ncbi:hypothetical protein MPLA_290067 [Mesorhizobium sp. ORS 3359]|nr:hypothetical protein MPLA_290067 [Mesorhizobium sp. ORS 3359]